MSKRTRASGITLVHWETGQCTEVPYYPGMHCAVYLMHVIVDSLKGQVQIKKNEANNKPITAHIHVYREGAPDAVIFCFKNRATPLYKIADAGERLIYHTKRVSYGVIEGNISMGDGGGCDETCFICKNEAIPSNYAADCLHRFHCKCLDEYMGKTMEAKCPKCEAKIGHNAIMRLGISINTEASMNLDPSRY